MLKDRAALEQGHKLAATKPAAGTRREHHRAQTQASGRHVLHHRPTVAPAGAGRRAYHGRVEHRPEAPANRLIGQTSPYLLQHAHDPVDWYPWGAEALDTRDDARPAGVPVRRLCGVPLVPCHAPGVVRRRDDRRADLNERFVSIKVDREERPDVDSLYMDARAGADRAAAAGR